MVSSDSYFDKSFETKNRISNDRGISVQSLDGLMPLLR